MTRDPDEQHDTRKVHELSDEEFFIAMKVPKPPPGYTIDELEKDNPFNQWMNGVPV